MKNLLLMLVTALAVCSCDKIDAPTPSGGYTAESRPVTDEMYNFVRGEWHYCNNSQTWFRFKSNDTLIVKFDGGYPDTCWYVLDRWYGDKDNIIRSWRFKDSSQVITFIEWKSDNTFYIAGGKYCR